MGQISDDVNKVEGLGNQFHETEEIDQQFDENDEDVNNDDDDDLFESGDLLDIEDKSSAVDEDNIYKQRFFRPALNEKEIENITANRPAMRSSSVTHSKNLDCFERFTLPRLRKTWNSHFEPLTGKSGPSLKREGCPRFPQTVITVSGQFILCNFNIYNFNRPQFQPKPILAI